MLSAYKNIYNIFTGWNHSAMPLFTDCAIIFLTRLDSCIPTVVQNLDTKILRDGTRVRHYGVFRATLPQLVTKKNLGMVYRFIWILGASGTLYSKLQTHIWLPKVWRSKNTQRRNYCNLLCIPKQNNYRSQQQLIGSIHWIPSWQQTCLLHPRTRSRLLTSHSPWIGLSHSMSRPSTYIQRLKFGPRYIYFS